MTKEEVIRNFIKEVWNEKRINVIEKYVSPSYSINIDPGDPWENQVLSHDEFRKRLNFSFNSFPDMHFEITSLIEDENHVAITWILTGTNRGSIAKHAPTHKPIRTSGMTIYHFTEHLINGHTQILDRRTVTRQLGF